MLALSDVVVASDQWTPKNARESFRVWRGILWRKTMLDDTEAAEIAGGYGYTIRMVSLENQAVVRDWLN